MKQEYRKPHHGHIASIFAGVCAGLDYAHNAKDPSGRPLHIVHRDISPQNIMVSLDGIAKIFDFGIAKAQGSLALTGIDRVKGKFAYMAPEQLRAKPVNAKADVFAVGVCLYEATTGKKPFAGQTEAELLAKRLEGTFPTPSEVIHKFPAELEQIILDAMAPDASRVRRRSRFTSGSRCSAARSRSFEHARRRLVDARDVRGAEGRRGRVRELRVEPRHDR